jgi:hypothetical protein
MTPTAWPSGAPEVPSEVDGCVAETGANIKKAVAFGQAELAPLERSETLSLDAGRTRQLVGPTKGCRGACCSSGKSVPRS